jgi:fatty-acid desaturase
MNEPSLALQASVRTARSYLFAFFLSGALVMGGVTWLLKHRVHQPEAQAKE